MVGANCSNLQVISIPHSPIEALKSLAATVGFVVFQFHTVRLRLLAAGKIKRTITYFNSTQSD